MNIFRKLLRANSKKTEKRSKTEERGKYMPEIKTPVDELFTINFKKNGGKFLYCENLKELKDTFQDILHDNNWSSEHIGVLDNSLIPLFQDFNFNTSKYTSEFDCFLSRCEYLISNDGSLLISSNQIAEKKLLELPNCFIMYATTSQLVENISEGLKGIKAKNQTRIPTNITTIKHFKTNEATDFLSYGSSAKNLYLLLLEDL